MDDAFSPDRRICVRFSELEMRMSHWVFTPTVIRTRDQRVIVALRDMWDCAATEFPERDRVLLRLRRYPDGARSIDVVVDVEAETCWRAGEPERAAPAATLAVLALTLIQA